MKLRSIQLIYFKEMLDPLRDRRTILSMVIAPLAVMPLIYLGTSYFFTRSEKQAKEQRYRLALRQAASLEGISGSLEQAGFRLQISDDPRRTVEKGETDMGVEVSGQGQKVAIKIYADLSKFEAQVASNRVERA